MKMPELIQALGGSLKDDNTNVNREKWANQIIENNISLIDLSELLDAERVISMRFMWLVGHVCDLNPEFVYASIPHFFSLRHDVRVLNYERSLAKLFHFSGVPSEIEGEAIHEMFEWLMDPHKNVSTKNYCLRALHHLSGKYPELKNELRLVMEDQLNKNTPTLDKLIRKYLSEELF